MRIPITNRADSDPKTAPNIMPSLELCLSVADETADVTVEVGIKVVTISTPEIISVDWMSGLEMVLSGEESVDFPVWDSTEGEEEEEKGRGKTTGKPNWWATVTVPKESTACVQTDRQRQTDRQKTDRAHTTHSTPHSNAHKGTFV